MKILLGLVLCIPLVAWLGCRCYKGAIFNQQCAGYLDNAAHASTIATALPELEKAIDYIESRKMTAGYTSIFWNTQDENVGFWYSNLVAARDDLRSVSQRQFSSFEESNVLMKLHEAIKEHGKDGSTVRVPNGISISPQNGGYFAFSIVALVAFLFGALIIAVEVNQ